MSLQSKASTLGVELLLELLAIYIAYRVNQISGLKTAVLVFLAASYLFYSLSSKERLWYAAGKLIHPGKSAILISCTGITYYGLKGLGFDQLLLTGLAFFLIGGAVGTLLYSYWEIGG